MKLLTMCLRSANMPAYLVAAFIKRLSQVSLTSFLIYPLVSHPLIPQPLVPYPLTLHSLTLSHATPRHHHHLINIIIIIIIINILSISSSL